MSAAGSTALISFFVFLSILRAGASDADALQLVLSQTRRPLSGAALSSSHDPGLTTCISCRRRSGATRDATVGLHSRNLITYRILAEVSPAPAPGPTTTTTAASRNRRRNRTYKRKIRYWLIGFLVCSVAGVFIGLVASLLFRMVLNFFRGTYQGICGTEIFSHVVKNKEELAFLMKDDGLANLEVIGRGACGEVYRKEISNSGSLRMIAIKQIRALAAEGGAEPLSGQDSGLLDKWMRQIRSEIKTVGRIRHRNLLPLIAYVSRPDCHFLIYEYMKNGSLHDMLRDAGEGRREFGWLARLRVAIGIAVGLEHLHVHHKPHIVHRDLKPANILIDDNMEARISNFGLAKEVLNANTHISTVNIAGTIGYIAPEYYQTMKFTTKCNIYSFGVILAVMVIGKFPSDAFFQGTEELSMVKWMRNQVMNENTAACFDGKLAGRGQDDQLELALRVACFCSADDPKERPSSKEVRLMLGQIGSD